MKLQNEHGPRAIETLVFSEKFLKIGITATRQIFIFAEDLLCKAYRLNIIISINSEPIQKGIRSLSS